MTYDKHGLNPEQLSRKWQGEQERKRLQRAVGFTPPLDPLEERKQRHKGLADYVRQRRDCWLITVPGALVTEVVALQDSTFAEDMRARNFTIHPSGSRTWLLADKVRVPYEQWHDGLRPATEGSTRPVAHYETFAGNVTVDCWEVEWPSKDTASRI